MASRIAALWDFNGPAFTVSAGDNSVFKALEIAQNMLALGEVEAVVVSSEVAVGVEEIVVLVLGVSSVVEVVVVEPVVVSWERSLDSGEVLGAVYLRSPVCIEPLVWLETSSCSLIPLYSKFWYLLLLHSSAMQMHN